MKTADLAGQVETYARDGLVILPRAIPHDLIDELRRQTDIARSLARQLHGPQAQRLQPIFDHDEIDPAPFHAFHALPELVELAAAALSTEHVPAPHLGVLFEPADRAWAMAWHRDWRDNVDAVDAESFAIANRDPGMFNQINAALWPDDSLWVVPGSAWRDDTAEEKAAYDALPPVERAATIGDYCHAMPGAIQVVLEPGDIAFYRASGWHLGSYTPTRPRATLHTGFCGPADRQWQATYWG